MCGRVVQASGPELLGLRIVNSFEGRDRRGGNLPPRYNAAPSQELWVIRQHPETGERSRLPGWWAELSERVRIAVWVTSSRWMARRAISWPGAIL